MVDYTIILRKLGCGYIVEWYDYSEICVGLDETEDD